MSPRGRVSSAPATCYTGGRANQAPGGGAAAGRGVVWMRGGSSLPWRSRASLDSGTAVAWATVVSSRPRPALDGTVASPTVLSRTTARTKAGAPFGAAVVADGTVSRAEAGIRGAACPQGIRPGAPGERFDRVTMGTVGLANGECRERSSTRCKAGEGWPLGKARTGVTP